MMGQTKIMDISQVRRIFKRVIREEPTPMDVVQAARESVQTMCQEAAQHGLTTADVLKTVLHPVFEKRRGCDCSGCKVRRDDPAEEQPLRAKAKVT